MNVKQILVSMVVFLLVLLGASRANNVPTHLAPKLNLPPARPLNSSPEPPQEPR